MKSGQRAVRVTTAGLLALFACGETPDGGDAAGDAAAADVSTDDTPDPPAAPAPVVPPAAPAPVSLMPCPPRWTIVDPRRPDGATTCSPGAEPWAACPTGELRIPGSDACTAISDCSETDGFPDDAPSAGDVRFVRPGATGGDGSRGAPFGALAEALPGATDATTIVLAAGTHEGGDELSTAVTLIGVCPSRTIVTASAASSAISVTAAGVRIESLTSSGAGGLGLSVAAGADARLIGVEVDGPVTLDGSLLAEDTSFRNGEVSVMGVFEAARVTTVDAEVDVSGSFDAADVFFASGGTGLAVGAGGRATVTRGVFAGMSSIGVYASGADAEVSLVDVIVAEVDGDDQAQGLLIENGASLVTTRLHVRGVGGSAIFATGEGTEARLDATVCVDAARSIAAGGLSSVAITEGAHAEIRGFSLEDSRGFGLSVYRASMVAEDLTLVEIHPATASSIDGFGLLSGASRVVVVRGLVRGAGAASVFVADNSQVRIEDFTIQDTRGAASLFGRGLAVQSGSKVAVARVAVEDSHEDGVFIATPGALVAGNDLRVHRTAPAEGGGFSGVGFGVHVQEAAEMDVRGLEVSESVGFGVVLAGEGARARLRDVVVRDTVSWERAPFMLSRIGRGIDVQPGSDLVLERALLERNRDVGIGMNLNCVVTLTDVTVRDTEDDGAVGRGGEGISVLGDGTLTARRLVIEGNRQVGIGVYGGAADVEDFVIRATRPTTCAPEGCPPAGVGLGAYGGSIDARAFVIEGNALAGIQVVEGAAMDLEGGVVSGSPIGASVLAPGYDFGRLDNRVRYRDNDRNLDSTSLPVPSPAPTLQSTGDR